MQSEHNDLLRRMRYYFVAFVVLAIFWRWLEWERYGTPNPNDIDTIIGAIAAISLGENYLNWKQR